MLYESGGYCPVCQTEGSFWCKAMDWEYRSTFLEYIYLKCPLCATIFIKDVPQKTLSEIYPANYYSFSGKSNDYLFKLKDAWDSRFYKPLLRKITSLALSLLDIGGGTGALLDMLKVADNRISYTEIVDIDKGAQQIAAEKGHIYNCLTIEEYQTDKKFDLILMLNLIEHVSDPFTILTKAEKMLLPGGMIIIKTPNADSLDARLFRHHYWGGLHCPRHWVIFTDWSFKKLLAPSALSINKITFTQGAPFWTYSVLQLFATKRIHQKEKPLIEHPLFNALAILFACFDIIRSLFSKTSQMFIVITK